MHGRNATTNVTSNASNVASATDVPPATDVAANAIAGACEIAPVRHREEHDRDGQAANGKEGRRPEATISFCYKTNGDLSFR